MADVPFGFRTTGSFPLDEKQIFNSIADFNALANSLKYDGMLVIIKGGAERGAYIYNAATNTLETISTANLDPSTIRIRDTNIISRAPNFDYSIGAGGPTVFKLGVQQNRTVSLTANRPPDAVTIDGQAKIIAEGATFYNHVLAPFGASRTNNGNWDGQKFTRSVNFSATENEKDLTNSQGLITNYTVQATVNKTLNIFGVYPMYSGHCASNIGINQIVEKINSPDLPHDVSFSEIIDLRGNRNVTFSSLSNRKPFFLIPSIYGNLARIIDQQFFLNVLVGSQSQVGFFAETERSIDQADGLAVGYVGYVYTQGISGTFTFRFEY